MSNDALVEIFLKISVGKTMFLVLETNVFALKCSKMLPIIK